MYLIKKQINKCKKYVEKKQSKPREYYISCV